MGSSTIIKLYSRLMCRRIFYPFNKALFFLALRGIGIGNWETVEVSGEMQFLKRFGRFRNKPVVFDVGANIGGYSNLVRSNSPNAQIYSFEPHRETFKRLQLAANQYNYTALNLACSDSTGFSRLFDHKQTEGDIGSEHASLVQGVIENIHSDDSEAFEVELTTLDIIREKLGIENIDLLKIDVEGHELSVLRGASKLLIDGRIDLIQFEFTETAIASRVYMKDFAEILKGYAFFRMLPDGLAPLGTYYSPIFEIFGYQNIIAVREEIADTFLNT